MSFTIRSEADADAALAKIAALYRAMTRLQRAAFRDVTRWRYAISDQVVIDAFLLVEAIREWDRKNERKGKWLPTYGSHRFFPLDPRPQDFHIRDIARSLSRTLRFNGHLDPGKEVTVAQHAVNMSFRVPEAQAFLALMHDAPETYLADVPSPVKRILGLGYEELERRCWNAIRDRYEIRATDADWAVVKRHDLLSLHTEARDYFPLGFVADGENWGGETYAEPSGPAWPAETAEGRFLARFRQLCPAYLSGLPEPDAPEADGDREGL